MTKTNPTTPQAFANVPGACSGTQSTEPAEEQTALTVFNPENIRTLSRIAPDAYRENQLSRVRCLDAGQALLNLAEQGMTDELDQRIARYLEKAKATLRKMNGRRTPVTQLFDHIRRAYTTLENTIDPAKADTIPARLQAARNDYARQKHEAEQRRIREELLRQQAEADRAQYRADVEDDLNARFNDLITENLARLSALDNSLTVDNYEQTLKALRDFPTELPAAWLADTRSAVRRPATLAPSDAEGIQAETMASLAPRFRQQYPYEIQSTRDDIADSLPSKLRELQRIAAAGAEEAARIKAELQARQQAEAQRTEQERQQRLEQQQAARQLQQQRREMDNLFGAPVAQPAEYRPKTQVRKRAVIRSADDIMRIVAYWWSQEGCNRPLADLLKDFKKQITFANNAANAKTGPTFIDGITYEDDIKAK